jgi:putative transposase
MPRAKRIYIPGLAWHITQRCHKREFLLGCHRDRKNWLGWMLQAIHRYHVTLLNYMVTSNHVHLLVLDDGPRRSIAQAMHLASGRTAQEYNIRKHRGGAFWEDRYHATAVATDIHLLRCMFYIDLNMVRAGVVAHPEEWLYCGFQEIIASRQRYRMVEKLKLCRLLGIPASELATTYQRWINEFIKDARLERESFWTQSLAVGKEEFVRSVKKQLGLRAKYRKICGADDTFELRENCQNIIRLN